VGGLSVTGDQQLAGAIMKTGGSIFLWTIIVFLWFRRFSATNRHEYDYRRGRRMPSAEIVGHDDDPLTYADVEKAFARVPAPGEPQPAAERPAGSVTDS
jgi:putative membrane protein